MNKKSLYSFNLKELESYLVDNGFSKFNADQIFQWVYKKFCFDPALWSNISKKLKEHLNQHIDLSVPKIMWNACSFDGTRKFLIQFNDNNSVETVLIPAKERLTL